MKQAFWLSPLKMFHCLRTWSLVKPPGLPWALHGDLPQTFKPLCASTHPMPPLFPAPLEARVFRFGRKRGSPRKWQTLLSYLLSSSVSVAFFQARWPAVMQRAWLSSAWHGALREEPEEKGPWPSSAAGGHPLSFPKPHVFIPKPR